MAGIPAASASSSETVIVTATGLLSPVAAVLEVGGTVLTQYHLIEGVDASIPTIEEPVLAALPGITVTADVSVSVQPTTESTGPHTPSDAFLQESGATRLASAGDTGQGVTVAVLDTGIDNLPDFAGRLVGGVDLTSENSPYQDSYGHGTFVAGLIAGNGASSNGQYSGEAPGAKLVSVKVAGADGTTHLGTLISGLQWVPIIRAGTASRSSTSPWGSSPASPPSTTRWTRQSRRCGTRVSRWWPRRGNAGPFNGTILSPGDDPLVITAGALDDMATTSITDDEMNRARSSWLGNDLVRPPRPVARASWATSQSCVLP
jgi:serine protease AprX